MKILYHDPKPTNIYAHRIIDNAYKNAFSDLGHEFRYLLPDNDQTKMFAEYEPDIFISTLHRLHIKYLNLDKLKQQKKKGMKVFFNMPFWTSPLDKSRINESGSLKDDADMLKIIKGGYGDVYFHSSEGSDPRMDGFEKETGYKRYTIPLAADAKTIFPEYSDQLKADISFLGTYLPDKKKFIDEQVFPLKKNYNLKLYGQDWTFPDKMLGWIQKGGQYFNLPYLKSIRKPKLDINDERKIYTSSVISINIHEDYQKKYGGDCNERTFKIPLAGGFEVTDDVACIRKYFNDGEEIIIAKNKDDWFDKINYYMKNQDKREKIIDAGRKRVLKDHTYKNRVITMLDIYNSLI